MKQLFFLLIAVAVSIVSCKKNDAAGGIKESTYSGTFQRQVSGSGPVASVSINFNGGKWNGQSDRTRYPALCSGTYTQPTANLIRFENDCVWTAEFDHTLILSGDYELKIAGDSMTFVKNYNGAAKDIYTLMKQ